MTPSRLLIFVPTYNENRNVERLCAELRALPLNADILFIDDGSPDGTGATLDRLARQHPRISVIHREGKLGIGSAHRAGIAYAYDKGDDLLIPLAAGFSHSPADLPRLLAPHAREGVRSGRFLLRLFFAQLANPGRFRRSRPIDRLRPELVESQGWDEYWSEKRTALGTLYDLVAAVYRRVIRRNLRLYAERSFAAGARVLHAGCGSGQVDAGLHERFRVTAVDISERALRLYARNNPRASRIEQASIFDLPFEAGAVDGVYNLGVLEHFHPHEIPEILDQPHPVPKPPRELVA